MKTPAANPPAAKARAAAPIPRALQKGSGERSFDAMEFSAIQRLDDKIDSRFFWLLGAFGAGFMILLTAFATGFLVLQAQIVSVQGQLQTQTTSLQTQTNAGFDKVNAKLDALTAQVAQASERVAKLEGAAEVRPTARVAKP